MSTHSTSRQATESFSRATYKVSEAAAIFGVSPTTIYRLIERGELKVIRLTRHILIPASELERISKA